jgi:uncharacterized membrane protein
MPLVRNLYRGLKQLFQTALSQTSRSFQTVVLVEYPLPGVWRVGFVSAAAKGEIAMRKSGDDLMAVFIPNTPNVTAGFLVYVPRAKAQMLDMSVEEAAKMIISAGLVAPVYPRPSMQQAPRPDQPKGISEAAE